MRSVGAARRGDVVFMVATQPLTPAVVAHFTACADALAEESGVRLICLGGGMFPVGLLPLGRLRARSGPTPRWARLSR